MGPEKKPASELSRELRLPHLVVLGLGLTAGTSAYVAVGGAMGAAGPGGLWLAFTLNGIVALITAAGYAELASAAPAAGGSHRLARMACGPCAGFAVGWLQWLATCMLASLGAVAIARYGLWLAAAASGGAWTVRGEFTVERCIAAGTVLVFLAASRRGACRCHEARSFLVWAQVALLAALAGVGAAIMAANPPSGSAAFDPFLPHGAAGLLAAMGLSYAAFGGYPIIAQVGDEAIGARRCVPKSILYCVFIAMSLCLAVACASTAWLGAEPDPPAWREIGRSGATAFGEAVSRVVPGGRVWSALAVALAAAASMAGAIPLATRSAWGLGRDRMVPSLSGCAGTENGTPRSSLLATGVLVLAGIAALPCADILATASLLFALWSILMSVCVVKARRNRGDELRYGFAMPFFPALPLGAILAHGVLAGSLWRVSPAAWAIAGAWAVAGGLVYRFYSRSRVEPMVDEGLVVEATGAEADGRYRVMMAVASTDSALGLVGPAYLLCGAKNATVELLHMVPVPEHVPLADAESCTAAGREAIGETTLYLAPAFPLATTIRYCRNVGRGIVEAARERRADLLIMGWHGATRTRLFTLGSTVDPVIERAPCNVVIVKNCEQTRFGNVLVPIAGGANGAFALEVGTILADKAGGRVVAFNAGGTGGSGFDLGSFVEANRARCALPRERIVTKESKGRLAVWSILREAEDAREAYDLIVIGCTEGGLGGAWVRPSVPETVARLSRKPVILVKASDGIQSWIKRWFQLEFGAKGA